MLAGYALPAAAEEVQPGVEIAAEVELTAAPDPQPQPEPVPEPEPQPEPTPEPQPEPSGETPTEAPTAAPTEPENTEPEVTEPQETQAPETTEPEVTEPEVTEPEETEPEETEPEVTEHEETEPERELAYPDPTLYYAAPVEERLVYGMNIVHPGTYDGCWDFPINSVTAVRYGGTLYATMHVGVAAAYRYLYFGSKAELEARLAQGGPFPVVDAVGNNGELLFHFTTGAADNSRLTLCLVAADDSQELGYRVEERELIIPAVPEEAMVALFAAPVTASVIAAGAYAAAPEDAQEQEAPGLLVAEKDQSTACAQFNITSATALAMDGTVYITLRVAPQEDKTYAYSYLYLDDADSLTALMDAGETVTAVLGVENNEDPENPCRVYHFTLSAGKLEETNYRVPVCLLKDDLIAEDAYAPMDLIVPTQLPAPAAPAPADEVPVQEDEPEGEDQENQGEQEQVGEPEEQEQEDAAPETKEDPAPTPVGYPAAPVEEQDVSGKMFVAKQDASDVYSMFGIEKATAVKVGDTIYATVYVNPPKSGVFTYSYMYFGTRTALIAQLDAGGKFDVVGASGVDSDLNKQIYHFTLPADKAGTRVPICVLKSDLTAKSPYNSSELELMVPADIPEGKVTPVPTPKDYPAAPATERDVTGLAVVDRETSAVYADFTITSATGIKVNGQTYLTALVKADEAGNFPYSYLYFGTLEQLKEQLGKGGAFDVVGYAANGEMRSYHFTLSADELDDTRRVPVCLLKADLKAENAYNTTELVLTIPETIEEKNSEAAKAIPTLPDDLSDAKIKVIKAADGKNFKMFTAGKTGMVIAGDKLLVRFEAPNPSFSRLYFGSKEDGFKSPYVQGKETATGGWVFEFELPASYRGTDNPICLGKPDGTWYNNQDLLIAIPADTGDTAVVRDDAGIIMAPTSSWTQVSFVIGESSAMLLKDRIYITITGKMGGTEAGKTATKLYLGSRNDADKSGCIIGTVNEDGTTTFSFSVSADKQGTSILAVAGYADGSWHTNQDFFLNIPNFNRGFDLSYYTDGVYDLYGNAYAYLDKVDNRGLAVDDGSTLTVSGDQITIKWVTRASDTDKLYFGQLSDDAAAREAQAIASTDAGTLNWKVFTITLPKSALNTMIPFMRHSPLWYQDTSGWLEKQDYLVLMNCLPRIGDLPDDTGTTIDPAGMKMLSGGSEVEQMFVITASSATLRGDTITCTITGRTAGNNSGKTADKLYLGSRFDKDKTSYITGTVNGDGTTTFVFDVSADKQGTSIPVVIGHTDGGWDATQDYFLNIPNFDGSFDLSYYTDGVYDLYGNAYAELSRTENKSFPVDKGSTLSISGDKIVIKWVCRSGSYDKVYFGLASDDEATRNAGAVAFEDYAGEATWKVYTVTLSKSALSARIPFARHSTKWYTATNGWLTTQDYLVLANRLPKLSSTPDIPVDPTDPSEPGGEIKDGYYQVTTKCSASMFKIIDAKLKVVNGQMTAELTLSGTGYDYLYAGTKEQAAKDKANWAPFTENAEGKYVYTIPVSELDKEITISSHSEKNNKWYDRTVTFLSAGLKKIGDVDPTDPSEPSGEIKDGYYQVTTECSASMFKIIDAKLKVVNGKMTAELTLSGTGYDYLYAGTGKEAENDKDNWAPFTVNADGKYVYTIPVSELDKEITISSHSKKNDEWYDRVVKFLSASLKKIGDVDPTDPTDPTTPTDPTAPTTPTDPTTPTSPSEPDTSGSTSAVNSNTTLKDGEYKPDGFTFSGGSGRVKIVCDKVIVKGGKAYAVIRFVSTSGSQTEYKYVKASGGVFYPTSDGKFTIPVALNANNRILGMTSKMSAAHEIEYSIYVQLKKAQSATSTGSGGGGSLSTEEEEKDDPDSKLDKTAPEILGLEFKENIKTSGARYLKLFQYDQGVVLAEVDLRRDTVLDTDEAAKALAQADKEAKEASQTVQSDEPADTAQITSDYVAAQYQGDILKYLLVPAGVELPAGLEKDYLIVSVPASNVYLMDETLAGTLDQLGALKNVSVVPEDCEDATLYDMLETGEKLPGGTWEKPDYRTIIKEKVALGLIGTEPLPLSEQALTERKETVPEREELTAVEYRDRLTKLTDRFAVLDIPLVVDRSADEPEARGQAAWLKLYGILFGKQDAAGKLYDAAIAKEDNA